MLGDTMPSFRVQVQRPGEPWKELFAALPANNPEDALIRAKKMAVLPPRSHLRIEDRPKRRGR